jgi:hypothetical protein
VLRRRWRFGPMGYAGPSWPVFHLCRVCSGWCQGRVVEGANGPCHVRCRSFLVGFGVVSDRDLCVALDGAIQRATASRGKRTLDITGCQLILVSNGAIQTIRGHYSDQTDLDAFWVE